MKTNKVSKHIRKSKSMRYLKAYYNTSKRIGTIALNSEQQHEWEHKRYQWAIYYISKREFTKLLKVLCETFNIPTPKVIVYNDVTSTERTATALVADNELVLTDSSMLQPLICVHEFVHFYMWHKYKCLESHNTGKMKSMISSILKTLRPKYDILSRR